MTPITLLLLSLINPNTTIRGCNPPVDMCNTLEVDCVASGVAPERCLELAQGVCPIERRLACDRVETACHAHGGDCKAIASHCEDALRGCNDAGSSCEQTPDLSAADLTALCFAWPLALSSSCADPSPSECMTTMSWTGCNVTACEYAACMADLEHEEVCTFDLPDSCAPVWQCIIDFA